MDPDRLERAEQSYEEAMAELESLEDPGPRKAAEVFLRGKSAIERMQDELDPDDEAGRAEFQRKLDALRERLRTASQ